MRAARPLWAALGLGAASLWLAPEVAAEPVELRRFALVSGMDDGGPERAQLQYAATDAVEVADVLSELGAVSDEDLLLLRNPSRADLLGGFDELQRRLDAAATSRVEVVVYYSGHSDETGLLLGTERLDYDTLRERLDALPAQVKIAVLDSCASGAMVRRKGGVHRPPFLVDESSGVEGHAIITSAAADEAAQESDRIGGSFFTHYLVSGLRGAADVDVDGQVTLNEAYRYAFDETLARTEGTLGGAQHASYDFELMGTGDLVITDLREMTAGVRLPEQMEGRFFVRDGNDRLQAELNKPFGKPALLGLSPGRYHISLEQEIHYAQATVDLIEGPPLQLSPLSFVSLAPEHARLRGGPLPISERFEGNPALHRSFLATSAVSMLAAVVLYSYTFQTIEGFEASTTVDELERQQRLTNGLIVGSGVFGGIGLMSGVGAAVTWPQKKRNELPEDWTPPPR